MYSRYTFSTVTPECGDNFRRNAGMRSFFTVIFSRLFVAKALGYWIETGNSLFLTYAGIPFRSGLALETTDQSKPSPFSFKLV
jgi:hypothetical protein